MEITFTLKDAGLFLIILAIIILLVYLIIMVRNLIPTIKHTQKLTEDAAAITAIARKRTEEVDGVLDDVKDSVSGVASALKGKESIIKSLSAVAKAISSLIGLFKGETKKDAKKDE